MKRIAVMLPHLYRGGSLRAAKNIAKALSLGAKINNYPLCVSFSYVKDGNYDTILDFSDLINMGIELRETQWKQVTRKEMYTVSKLLHLQDKLTEPIYLLPKDGASDFFDCDLWIIISDRTNCPIFPLKKYINVIYDYIQRYVPEIFGSDQNAWDIQEDGFFKTTRAAEKVFVSTTSTKNDLISYCGVPSSKISLINMDFNPPKENEIEMKPIISFPYFLWVTNTSQHKNHMRTLEGISKYLQGSDALDCVLIGASTQNFSESLPHKDAILWNHPYISQVRERISSDPLLQSKVHILGEVSDSSYNILMKNSEFLLHSCLYDNGTFSVMDAGFWGCPSLSSKYPAMGFINNQFNLNLHFFDPYDSDDLCANLQIMQKEAHNIKLPPKENFFNYSWEANANELFNLVLSCF